MSESGPENPSFIQPDGSPDWDAIRFDVFCSRCGYNLRTLSRPKCPECGLEFAWSRVLAKSGFRSDFLFEHHWHERPIRSFLRTAWVSLRPRKFWKQVSIHDRIEPGPLCLLVLLSCIVFSIVLHGLAWLTQTAVEWLVSNPAFKPARRLSGSLWDLFQVMAGIASTPFQLGFRYVWVILLVICPLLGAWALLCSLWQTMGQFKIRTIQIFRVIAYTSVPVCFWWAITWFFTAAVFSFYTSQLADRYAEPFCIFTTWIILGIYLSAGIKWYLVLPKSRLLAMVASFVGYLATITLAVMMVRFQLGLFR